MKYSKEYLDDLVELGHAKRVDAYTVELPDGVRVSYKPSRTPPPPGRKWGDSAQWGKDG